MKIVINDLCYTLMTRSKENLSKFKTDIKWRIIKSLICDLKQKNNLLLQQEL